MAAISFRKNDLGFPYNVTKASVLVISSKHHNKKNPPQLTRNLQRHDRLKILLVIRLLHLHLPKPLHRLAEPFGPADRHLALGDEAGLPRQGIDVDDAAEEEELALWFREDFFADGFEDREPGVEVGGFEGDLDVEDELEVGGGVGGGHVLLFCFPFDDAGWFLLFLLFL